MHKIVVMGINQNLRLMAMGTLI